MVINLDILYQFILYTKENRVNEKIKMTFIALLYRTISIRLLESRYYFIIYSGKLQRAAIALNIMLSHINFHLY